MAIKTCAKSPGVLILFFPTGPEAGNTCYGPLRCTNLRWIVRKGRNIVSQRADVSEKRVPVSCMPSPESPENRIDTSSSSITFVSIDIGFNNYLLLLNHKNNFFRRWPIIKSLRGKTPVFGENCFLADNAVVIGDTTLGDNCSIWFGAVLRGDVNYIRIGNNVNIQDNAVIHCTYEKSATNIGNNVSIATGPLFTVVPSTTMY